MLTAAGYRVLGIDPSPAMLELAAERAPEALFKLGDAATAELPRCIAVAALGEPLNYVAGADPDAGFDLQAIFARIHEALMPGGILAFDLAGPTREAPREAVRNWTEGDGWTALVELTQTGRLLRRRKRERPGHSAFLARRDG